MKTEITKLTSYKKELQSQKKELESKVKYAKCIMELNAYIVGSRYKKDVVEHVAKDVLATLYKLDKDFDLETHLSLFSML